MSAAHRWRQTSTMQCVLLLLLGFISPLSVVTLAEQGFENRKIVFEVNSKVAASSLLQFGIRPPECNVATTSAPHQRQLHSLHHHHYRPPDDGDDNNKAVICTRRVITDLSSQFMPSDFNYFQLFLAELAASCFRSDRVPCGRFETFDLHADWQQGRAGFSCQSYSECVGAIKMMRSPEFVKNYDDGALIQDVKYNYLRRWIDWVS